MKNRLALLPLLLLLAAACATSRPAPLAPAIDTAISRPPFDRAVWAILVSDESGKTLYAHNPGTLMMPASNRKLFAAATVAGCLGLDTRLETSVWRDGDDLVVRGGGDPSLGSWRYAREDDFADLARSLRERGITRVRDVVADVSAFDRVTIPGSWKHGNLGSDYAAAVDAIAWGESEVPVDRAVEDPAMHAANALREALLLAGIAVDGTTRTVTEPRQWAGQVASIPSPFVAHLLTTMLKNSHNLYAEMLFKRSTDGTYASSFESEHEFLVREAGVPEGSFRFADGSGLAPDDLVAPEAVVAVLRWMDDPVRRGLWWSLLARPNQEGTLRRRLVELEDRFAGKTGTINGVNALSGILAMPDGSHRYVSVIVNHHLDDGDRAVEAIDAVIRAVAADSERP